MTSREALEKIYQYNNHYIKDKEYLFLEKESEEWKAILKDLDVLEMIKHFSKIDKYKLLGGIEAITITYKTNDNEKDFDLIKECLDKW